MSARFPALAVLIDFAFWSNFRIQRNLFSSLIHIVSCVFLYPISVFDCGIHDVAIVKLAGWIHSETTLYFSCISLAFFNFLLWDGCFFGIILEWWKPELMLNIICLRRLFVKCVSNATIISSTNYWHLSMLAPFELPTFSGFEWDSECYYSLPICLVPLRKHDANIWKRFELR